MIKSVLKKNIFYSKSLLLGLYYSLTLKNPLLPTDPVSILFVCRGNICRSPFAQELSPKLIKKNKIIFFSAGLEVNVPSAPPPEAIEAARHFGIDLSKHISCKLTDSLIENSDIVMVMEANHLKKLRASYPSYKNKFFLLSLYNPHGDIINKFSIEDPYGKDVKEYEKCFYNIKISLENLFNLLEFND